MMCGVMRTDGMRPFCARRRTVVSLTCRIAASWRAVRNSSRELCDGGAASSICEITRAPRLSFARALNCEGDAVDARAFDLHIFRLGFCALGPDRDAIDSLFGRETKDSLPTLVAQAP